ncbi:type IV pilin-like G/H family protein [Acaryochloris sp. CCMEE 5410]|uniref:type IV pilin-like G/H family protein n=1 Tax=Acaryochloris sp. CCMEE 5410 TaxID=310037 RepID=UPI001111957A|nr:type IV pilin-like G/H family protein [Acaryochloris sp. CCMEE 5410]KAI9130610.1 type IV pilin-like G/H family protein [Acaryochloris sp. CCMEE 5410]
MPLKPNFRSPFKSVLIFSLVSLMGACSGATENSPETSPPAATSPGTPAPTSSPVNTARNAEGETTLGAVLRAQQAYYLEYGKFAASLEDLQIGITMNYFTFAGLEADTAQTTFKAVANEAGLNSYAGGVASVDSSFEVILCESSSPSQDITPPQFEGGTWSCSPESQKVEG